MTRGTANQPSPNNSLAEQSSSLLPTAEASVLVRLLSYSSQTPSNVSRTRCDLAQIHHSLEHHHQSRPSLMEVLPVHGWTALLTKICDEMSWLGELPRSDVSTKTKRARSLSTPDGYRGNSGGYPHARVIPVHPTQLSTDLPTPDSLTRNVRRVKSD